MNELERLIAEQARDMEKGHWISGQGRVSLDALGDGVYRKRKLKASDDGHGKKLHYYTVLGCRCEKCKKLSRDTKRKWRAKLRKPSRPYKYVLTCTCCGGTDVQRRRVYE